jgi:replication factor A1
MHSIRSFPCSYRLDALPLNVGETMSDDGRYATQIAVVKEECKDADEAEIIKEFRRYEEEFLIPPEDALRSVIRKFQIAAGQDVSTISSRSRPAIAEKKVTKFSELKDDDKNVTIEVAVVSYIPKIQTVRGEERQIAYGWVEDSPWEGERERWDFTDWGDHSQNLTPGSVVRLEGVSVNFWNDRRSININRPSRVTVLKEGGQPVTKISDEPVPISEAGEAEGIVSVVARVLSKKDDQIVKKDGSGTLDIVRGRLADPSGTIGFISWRDFEHEVGSLIKIDRAQIRRFRDTPEINIGDLTKIEPFHDSSFASMDDLQSVNRSTISELRDGARDIEITVQVENWQARTFTNADGEERTVRSGDVMDPTGRCRLTSWGEMSPEPGAFLHLKGARVQFWQGSPDLVIDSADQVIDLSDPPWDAIDPADHWVEVDLTDLVNGGSRRGIRTAGTVVAIANNSGIIERCPECRRVMREGECAEHGPQRGDEDVRLRFILDDGISNASTLIGKEATEALTGMDQAQIRDAIDANTRAGYIATLRERFLARKLHVNGRAMVDTQGAILMADSVELDTRTPEEAANEVMARWGVVL